MPQERPGRNGGTLKSVAKGETLNPKGRGKGTLNTKTILTKWLSQQVKMRNPATQKEEKMTAIDAITIAMIGQAMSGDTRAYQVLMDRLEGKPAQRVELTGEEGGPIVQEHVHAIDYKQLDDDTLRKISAARKKKNG